MLCLACLSTGCSHSEPFTNNQETDTPFDPGPPARLTLNPASDRGPSWLPDGSRILYSAQQSDRDDNDVCLAEIPATGGSQRRLVCDVAGGKTTRDAVQSAIAGDDGRLALLTAGNGSIVGESPVFLGIAIAPTLDAFNAQTVLSLPFTASSGLTQDYAGYLHWLGADRLLYVGQQFRALRACPQLGCPLDTLLYGTDVTVVDVVGDQGTPAVIPGTTQATGVAPWEDGSAILYTVANDSRIYRRGLAGGPTVVWHDFGAAGIVRDVSASATRVAAVVGGRIAYDFDPRVNGPTQSDSGGVIHVLDADGSNEVVLDTPERLYRRPAVSPDGTKVVAEGYELIITGPAADRDTTVSKSGDLYLFGGE